MDEEDGGRGVAPGFRRITVTVPPGGRLAYVDEVWRDALVVVEHGAIDLCSSHHRLRLGTGAVLFLEGLGLVALQNPGTEDAVLAAHARRARP